MHISHSITCSFSAHFCLILNSVKSSTRKSTYPFKIALNVIKLNCPDVDKYNVFGVVIRPRAELIPRVARV